MKYLLLIPLCLLLSGPDPVSGAAALLITAGIGVVIARSAKQDHPRAGRAVLPALAELPIFRGL